MRPLIAIPSPRDIPEFLEATFSIPCDKYWVKYHKEAPAYAAIRRFFLGHREYTHLVLLPDDLIATPQDFERLCRQVQDNGYAAISGMCNVDTRENKDALNICKDLPKIEPESRTYKWMRDGELPPGVFRAGFSGEALMFLRRDVVERLTFRGDYRQSSFDLIICHELAALGIPVYVDPAVRMLHLRYGGEILVGKEPPVEYFDLWTERSRMMAAYRLRRLGRAYSRFVADYGTTMGHADAFLASLVESVQKRLNTVIGAE